MPVDNPRGRLAHRRGVRAWRRVGAPLGLFGALALVVGLLAPAVPSAAGATSSINVLYAGSLMDLMVQHLAPAFHRLSGDSVVGYPGGSLALASEISGGTVVGDVFISASPSVNERLHRAGNGDWVSRYVIVGESPLVLGYRTDSRFATALSRSPWYQVVTRPGFLLGRTDPSTDPKGRLALKAMKVAARRFRRPALAALASSTSNVYPETTLVGRLQAGQLDAGFFYEVEAKSAQLAFAPLVGTRLRAVFTVAVLRGAPHAAAARAFVAFLGSRRGRAILAKYGVEAPTGSHTVVSLAARSPAHSSSS